MLDIVPPPSSSSKSSRMAVERSPYLLAASPPGSGLDLYALSLAFSDYRGFRTLSSLESDSRQLDKRKTLDNREFQDRGKEEEEDYQEVHVSGKVEASLCLHHSRHNRPLKSIIVTSDGDGGYCSGSGEDSVTCSPTSPSPSRMRKHVSFADHFGKPLAEVRTMLESSSEPPVLSIVLDDEDDPIPFNPLRVAFPQPCADFQAFENKMQSNMVNVENVFVDEYKVEGTVFVQNYPAQKAVFARFTVDSWETHSDVDAEFCISLGSNDRYKFQFEVPRTSDRSKSVEFAVCFKANGTQHWDSNEGVNFVIAWEPVPPVFEVSDDSCDDYEKNLNNNSSPLDGLAWWYDSDHPNPYY